MEDSPARRYAMDLLEEPYDEAETSDSMFAALYLDDSQKVSENEKIREIFMKERGTRYKPGTTFPWK